MKVVLVNSADLAGGAAIATYRLHRALRAARFDTTLMVQSRTSNDPSVSGPPGKLGRALALLRPSLDKLALRHYPNRSTTLFSPAAVPDTLARHVSTLNPDIVHLFWVAGGFLRIESLAKFGKPIVWTLHDMWPLTGGCHYDGECGEYRRSCGSCPVLGSSRARDLSSRILKRKIAAWSGVDITIVATSRWLADCARASAIFSNSRIETIPNCLDTDVFKPASKRAAQELFGLPADKNLILVSAFNVLSDPRKGFQHLIPALKRLSQTTLGESTELVVVGASEPDEPADIGLPIHYIERLGDDYSQTALYSAVDVLAAPSTQENLSNTVLESLSCATPVVAFDIGGMPDLIKHQENGYLAKAFEVSDLAEGLAWCLDGIDRKAALAENARQHVVENYTHDRVARAYGDLYESLKR